MEEKGEIRISLSTFFLIIAIIVIIIMGMFMYQMYKEIDSSDIEKNTTTIFNKNNTEKNAIVNEEKTSTNIENNIKENYKTEENNKKSYTTEEVKQLLDDKIKDVKYRTETGESSGFIISNNKVYVEALKDDASGIIKGILGVPQYIVPIDKQINKTAILTENGNLYVNKPVGSGESSLYGNEFVLVQRNIVAIIEIPEVEGELMILTSEGEVRHFNGDIYLDLTK